jgi:Zn-finger nucleic acid-binding protein
MKCPVCSVELKMMDRQRVEIDYCPKCRGVWLDRGELDKIMIAFIRAEASSPRLPLTSALAGEDSPHTLEQPP